MAITYSAPGARITQPDPFLSNVMANSAALGGWIQDNVIAVKPVLKDFVRYGKIDVQTMLGLGKFVETLRAPGARPNLLSRPMKEWLTAIIAENAVQIEVPQEDIMNDISPDGPLIDAAVLIQNVLRYVNEVALFDAFQPANLDAAHKFSAFAPWSGTGTKIKEEVYTAQVLAVQNGGVPMNGIIFPPSKWPGVWASQEVQHDIGAGFRQDVIDMNGGIPPTFYGMKPFVPGMRTDTNPTGTFTPAFVWDDNNIRMFYSPTINGGTWNGKDPTAFGQFENQIGGTAFEAQQMPSPYFAQDGLTLVWGDFRRSPVTMFNPDLAFVIQGV